MKCLLLLWVLLSFDAVQGVLEWTVIGKVNSYGQNVTLFCNVSNCCPKYAGWDRWTPQQQTLFIDVKTGRSNNKYDGYVLGDGYTLVIKNLTKEDLNISYACLYDVTLGERKILFEEDIFTYITSTEPNNVTGISTFSDSNNVGIIAGVLFPIVALIIIAFSFWRQRRKRNKRDDRTCISEEDEEDPFLDRTCISEEDEEDPLLDETVPSEIRLMGKSERKKYLQILKDGKETRYVVKIFILGKNGVGKTSLMRRLLGESIGDVERTEGIDIVKRCKIRVRDGHWEPCEVEEDKSREQRFGRFLQSKDVNDDKGNTDDKILSNDEHSMFVGETDINDVKGDTDSEKLIQNEETNKSSMPTYTSFDVEKMNSSSKNVNDVKSNPILDVIEGKYMEQHNGKGKRDDINKSTNFAEGSDPNHTATSSLALNKNDKHMDTIAGTDILNKDKTEDKNDIFGDVEKGLNAELSKDEYAECIFLDFAGQKEYYTTHQTFLTKKAVYLITASLQDSKVFDNKDDEDNMSFWFDNIHCYGTNNETSTNVTQLDPPIIVVCTGQETSETINKEELKRKTMKFEEDVNSMLTDVRRQHLRGGIHFLSNKIDDDTDFNKLRKSIYNAALKLPRWKEANPVRWIHMEKTLDNERGSRNVISRFEIKQLAKGLYDPIDDEYEVNLFLKYQHELGNVIFFEDKQDYIIIKPSWLIDAFKCLVCANEFRKELLQCPEWKNLKKTGKVNYEFIGKLLSHVPDCIKHMNYVLEVMMKFDIIVRDDSDPAQGFIIPSMIEKTPTYSWENICEEYGANGVNCERTPWICLDFDFLPPAIFNNILVWFMKDDKYKRFELYHKIGIFDIKVGHHKLVICNSHYSICLQGWSWKNNTYSWKNIYSSLRDYISSLKSKYGVMINYKVKCMCGEVNFTSDGKFEVEELKVQEEIYCRHHRNVHTLSFKKWIDDKTAMSNEFPGAADNFNRQKHTPTVVKDELQAEIELMTDKQSVPLYLKLLESGFEKKRDIRLVIVGKRGAGKTSFIRRLLGEDLRYVTSTNGIEIHKIKCKAMSDDGIWNKIAENNEESEINARLLKQYRDILNSKEKAPLRTRTHTAIDEHISATDFDVSKESQTEYHNTDIVKSPGITESESKTHVASVSQEPQPNVMKKAQREIKAMLESPIDFHDKDEYATLWLWDLAGDEEFFHTHQTFFTSNAIYLVVAKLNEADDKEARDLFQLWMDSIHCYSRLEEDRNKSDVNKRTSDDRDPSVVIVGTWKDALISNVEKIDHACRKSILKYTENMSEDELVHIRQEYFISNTEDDPSVFQQIRENILHLARKMKTWNKDYPLKFIQLETRLQEKKKLLPIISFNEIQHISTDTPNPLNDEELRLFLEFHHEIRALVYFKDLPSYIILDTQWLSDVFRCIVTAKKFSAISIRNKNKWKELYSRGKLHSEVLDDIFRKSENIFSKHKNHILNVMEKFDILIRLNISGTERDAGEDKPLYYIPCMIKKEPECDIYEMFNVTEDTCYKSTWLCYMFRFLPPHLMNHLIASLCRKFEVAEFVTKEQKRQIALFRSSAVFELEKTTKLAKLYIMKCPHWIQIQVWQFGKGLRGGMYKYIDNVYKYIDDIVTEEIVKIRSTRFEMSDVIFMKKWECGLTKPECVTGSNDFSEKRIAGFYCAKCTSTHKFIDEWQALKSRIPCVSELSKITPSF